MNVNMNSYSGVEPLSSKPPTQSGKVTIVTGANSGIGYETAKGLARMGATVVMICRSREKGETARQQIIADTGNQEVHLLLADLAVQSEVRKVAAAFKSRFSRLDILINNAALIPPQRQLTSDGIEMQVAINHLAYFLLTCELLDVIKASTPARIVNVSSNVHPQGKVNFDDLEATSGYGFGGTRQYSNTKLMNILFTRELARRLDGFDVTVNAVHPGVIATQLTRGVPWPIGPLIRSFLKKPDFGAQTSLHVAISEEGGRITGEYWADNQVAAMSAAARDDAAARRLWDVSLNYVGMNDTAR
jgi:NAD(P)-dependent dehydrogenase (short-subunit alcohol dehydrogenase family)